MGERIAAAIVTVVGTALLTIGTVKGFAYAAVTAFAAVFDSPPADWSTHLAGRILIQPETWLGSAAVTAGLIWLSCTCRQLQAAGAAAAAGRAIFWTGDNWEPIAPPTGLMYQKPSAGSPDDRPRE